MKPATQWSLRRFGFRRIMVANGILAALAIGACGFLTRDTPHWLVGLVLFLGGAFRSMQFTSLSAIQFADVPAGRMARANTFASMVQQLTLGLGITVGAALLNASAWLHGRGAGAPALADFRFAFFGAAALALLGLVDSFRLDRAAGSHVSGHAG